MGTFNERLLASYTIGYLETYALWRPVFSLRLDSLQNRRLCSLLQREDSEEGPVLDLVPATLTRSGQWEKARV